MPTPPTMLSKPGRCNINSYNDWTTTQGSPSYQTGWLGWWVYVSRLLRSLDYDKSKVHVDKVVVMFQSGWTAHIDTLLIHLLYVPKCNVHWNLDELDKYIFQWTFIGARSYKTPFTQTQIIVQYGSARSDATMYTWSQCRRTRSDITRQCMHIDVFMKTDNFLTITNN